MAQCKDVFYYASSFQRESQTGRHELRHYHPVVLDIQLGDDGLPKKGVVIITKYTPEKERYCQERDGENSCVILETQEYGELSYRSLIRTVIHGEDERNLLDEDMKLPISDDILEKVKTAARTNKGIKPRLRKLL